MYVQRLSGARHHRDRGARARARRGQRRRLALPRRRRSVPADRGRRRTRVHARGRIRPPRHDRRAAGALSAPTDAREQLRQRCFASRPSASRTAPPSASVVDGCPPRLPLAVEEIQRELDRRRPGQSAITTQRREADQVEILSGHARGADARHADRDAGPQPGHALRGLRGDADEVPPLARRLHLRGEVRHPRLAGRRPRQRARDHRAGRGRRGRAQGAGRRGRRARVDIVAWVERVPDIEAAVDPATVTRDAVDANIVALPRRGDGRAR